MPTNRHPKALKPFFLTEMWERFGFYIVQGLLIVFLTSYLNFNDAKAYLIVGQYTALIYISPLLGGFIADRVLGYRYSIVLGGILLCLGYALVSLTIHHLIFIGLTVIILGNGFLKPNISSYLGEFYEPLDHRRDAGFTIFYMGINIGSTLSTLSAGFIQRHFGWHITFLSAAIGMVIAILSFVSGFKYFFDKGLPIPRLQIKPKYLTIFSYKLGLLGLLLVTAIIVFLLLVHPGKGDIIETAAGVLLFGGLLLFSRNYSRYVRDRLILLIVLVLSSIIFWGTFFQMFFSVNLFVLRSVDRHLFGIEIPAVAIISLETIFILILGLPLAKLWNKVNQNKNNLLFSLTYKFAFAILAVAIATFTLVLAIDFSPPGQKILLSWVILYYLLLTIGEMLISPIGLAMITELSPKNLTGLMMGLWFLSLGFGAALAGVLDHFADVPRHLNDLVSINAIYHHAFLIQGSVALFTGVLLCLLKPWLSRLRHLNI